jgi:hypothetical protein
VLGELPAVVDVKVVGVRGRPADASRLGQYVLEPRVVALQGESLGLCVGTGRPKARSGRLAALSLGMGSMMPCRELLSKNLSVLRRTVERPGAAVKLPKHRRDPAESRRWERVQRDERGLVARLKGGGAFGKVYFLGPTF